MSTLFKDIFTVAFFDKFSDVVTTIIPGFNREKFVKSIFTDDWDSKELKERMKHIALVLHDFLPGDYESATKVIKKIINQLKHNDYNEMPLEFMFFPEYIEMFGLDDFETSVKTMEFVTQFTSCEFAVRPFIIKYGDKMLGRMLEWSLHENDMVRRLASEGSRPRLPWAMALPALKSNPTPILPILENLKNDTSEWVRKSVANNLNDISKDNPDVVKAIAKKWKGVSKETDWIIKHACRTLLKQGDEEVLAYFNHNKTGKVEVANLKVTNPELKIGEDLFFTFTLQNRERTPQNIRIEYGIYYMKQNRSLSRKIYKISERELQPDEKIDISRKQSFRIITTRKFYVGEHKLSIIINGREQMITEFELSAD